MSELDYFGKRLIEEVRDRVIRGMKLRMQGQMKDIDSKKLEENISVLNENGRQIIENIIQQTVDLALHNILCLIDEDKYINITVNGKSISDVSDGLSGELYTEDGWIQRYSKESTVGDCI